MFVSDVFKLGVHWVCIKRSSLKSFCALPQKKGKLLAEEGNVTKVPVHTHEERERERETETEREANEFNFSYYRQSNLWSLFQGQCYIRITHLLLEAKEY